VHINGFNLVTYLTGKEPRSPRKGFFYFDDDGNMVALRFKEFPPRQKAASFTFEQASDSMESVAAGNK
jgi:hypothetical protein